LAFPGELWEKELGKLSEMVNKNTQGRLIIKIYSSDSILKAPEILDGVAHKTIEAGGTATSYFAGRIPETNLMYGIPFFYDKADQMIENVYDYRNGELFKLIQEAFQDQGKVHYLAYVVTSSSGLFGNFAVSGLNGFKGKKIRSSGMTSALVKELGASPVNLPGAEQYTSFQRGTIDGTVYPFRSMKDYGLTEVVKFMLAPPFFPGTEFGVICNPSAFKALPADIRATLEKTAVDWARNVITKNLQNIDAEYISWIQKQGVKKTALPDGDVTKIKNIVKEKVIPSYANKTPRCKKMWSLILEYGQEKGLTK